MKTLNLKLNTSDVEYAVGIFFNPRVNIIVPNIFWGMGLNYEADLWILSPAGYITEIEIKVSEQDLRAESKKWHPHNSIYVRRLFFAVPDHMSESKHFPDNCGIISVNKDLECKIIRPAKIRKNAEKLPEAKKLKFLHLGCMRIWGLKESLARARKERQKHCES